MAAKLDSVGHIWPENQIESRNIWLENQIKSRHMWPENSIKLQFRTGEGWGRNSRSCENEGRALTPKAGFSFVCARVVAYTDRNFDILVDNIIWKHKTFCGLCSKR